MPCKQIRNPPTIRSRAGDLGPLVYVVALGFVVLTGYSVGLAAAFLLEHQTEFPGVQITETYLRRGEYDEVRARELDYGAIR